MKKKIIYGLLSLLAMTLGTATLFSCSDNYDQLYKPETSALELDLKIENLQSGTYSNYTLSLPASMSTTTVEVCTNTRWKVRVEESDGWCAIVNNGDGKGNGTFGIRVEQNYGGAERNCRVVVLPTDADGNEITGDPAKSIVISQSYSDVYFNPYSLETFAANDITSRIIEIVADDDIDWTMSVTYNDDSNTGFIHIDNLKFSNQQEEYSNVSNLQGHGSATFNLHLDANHSTAARAGSIILESGVGRIALSISQGGTQASFDAGFDNLPDAVSGTGATISASVYSPDVSWEIQDVRSWMKFDKLSGAANSGTTNLIAEIAPNPSTTPRSAIIYFKPLDDRYPTIAQEITQAGMVFKIDDYNPDIVYQDGETREIRFESQLDWEVSDLSNVEIEGGQLSGSGSDGQQSIKFTIRKYEGNSSRNCGFKIRPKTTDFGVYGTLSANDITISPLEINLVQFGGREPAVSMPWVTSFGQTFAKVEFNYYSPFHDVTGAGIRWKKYDEGDDKWQTLEYSAVEAPHNGYITVEIDNLTAATQYVLQGYVVYSKDDGTDTKFGPVTQVPFTTAGTRPGSGDNPTPGI